jgi:hypothetical protein
MPESNMDKRANRPKKIKAMITSSRPPVGIKRLTLDLPEPLHRAIKRNAAEEGVTMAQKLRVLLSEHYRLV